MTTFTGNAAELTDFLDFIGNRAHGVGGLPSHTAEIVVRTEQHHKTLKNGTTISLPRGSDIVVTQQVYRGTTDRHFSRFQIEIPDSVVDGARDLQLILRDPRDVIVFRSERTAPRQLRTEIGSVYVLHDAIARVDDIRNDVMSLIGTDPFAGVTVPSDFGVDFYEELARPSIDAILRSLVRTIESGDFPGIGKEEVASTGSELVLSGNTFAIDLKFFKHTKQLVRLNSGGPPMRPSKRFLTLSVQARILPTSSYDIGSFTRADLLDVDVKSKKVLVAVGAPFANSEKYVPSGTERDIATGLDAAIVPLANSVSAAMGQLPNLPLLSGLSSLLGSGVTATLTGFDTTPEPRTRGPQLRPVVALGFPRAALQA